VRSLGSSILNLKSQKDVHEKSIVSGVSVTDSLSSHSTSQYDSSLDQGQQDTERVLSKKDELPSRPSNKARHFKLKNVFVKSNSRRKIGKCRDAEISLSSSTQNTGNDNGGRNPSYDFTNYTTTFASEKATVPRSFAESETRFWQSVSVETSTEDDDFYFPQGSDEFWRDVPSRISWASEKNSTGEAILQSSAHKDGVFTFTDASQNKDCKGPEEASNKDDRIFDKNLDPSYRESTRWSHPPNFDFDSDREASLAVGVDFPPFQLQNFTTTKDGFPGFYDDVKSQTLFSCGDLPLSSYNELMDSTKPLLKRASGGSKRHGRRLSRNYREIDHDNVKDSKPSPSKPSRKYTFLNEERSSGNSERHLLGRDNRPSPNQRASLGALPRNQSRASAIVTRLGSMLPRSSSARFSSSKSHPSMTSLGSRLRRSSSARFSSSKSQPSMTSLGSMHPRSSSARFSSRKSRPSMTSLGSMLPRSSSARFSSSKSCPSMTSLGSMLPRSSSARFCSSRSRPSMMGDITALLRPLNCGKPGPPTNGGNYNETSAHQTRRRSSLSASSGGISCRLHISEMNIFGSEMMSMDSILSSIQDAKNDPNIVKLEMEDLIERADKEVHDAIRDLLECDGRPWERVHFVDEVVVDGLVSYRRWLHQKSMLFRHIGSVCMVKLIPMTFKTKLIITDEPQWTEQEGDESLKGSSEKPYIKPNLLALLKSIQKDKSVIVLHFSSRYTTEAIIRGLTGLFSCDDRKWELVTLDLAGNCPCEAGTLVHEVWCERMQECTEELQRVAKSRGIVLSHISS
jgi:hypothetical protein